MDKRDAIDMLEKGQGWIRVASVENILRRETSCIAPEDVAILMKPIYEASETPFPPELQEEINSYAAERGDLDEGESLESVADQANAEWGDDE